MRRLLLLALLPAVNGPARADVPPLLVPPAADSVRIDRPAAPLLLPGREPPADTLARHNQRRALEMYALGRSLDTLGDPAAAISAYRRAVQFNPGLRDAHLRMARRYVSVQQTRAAADEYRAEVAVDPGNREAQRGLAVSLAQLGDTTGAIPKLLALVGGDPRDEASWQALSFAYGLAHRYAQAEQALRRALALAPRDPDAWRDLGVVLAARNRPAEARAAYRQAGALDPGDPTPWLNLGNLERRAGRADAAAAAYREAERRDSTSRLAYRGQILVYRSGHREPEAGEVYRRMLHALPKEFDVRVEAVQLYDSLGRRDIALELARDAVRAMPGTGDAHLLLGTALRRAGDYGGALLEFRTAGGLLASRRDQAGVEARIRSLRADAPDSLHARFAADSLAHETPPGPPPGPPGH